MVAYVRAWACLSKGGNKEKKRSKPRTLQVRVGCVREAEGGDRGCELSTAVDAFRVCAFC
jgi:hypothetical protein